MHTKRFNLSISVDLLDEVDQAAKANYSTRSNYIREALLLRLQGEAVIKQQKAEFMERLKQFDKRD